MSPRSKPTQRQLAYLKALAERTGQTFAYPATAAQASAEITRLKHTPPTSRPERHLERKAIADRIQAGPTDAARIRDDEIRGRGSTATWAHHRDPQPPQQPRPATGGGTTGVGERTELARYTVPSGERILYGQRINGIVRVTDRPAQAGERAYLVERELETKQELDALIADYVSVALRHGKVPAAHIPLDSYLSAFS